MTPTHFRAPSHVELVAGASDVGSFEREIERGKLGTTRGAHEVHGNATLEYQHRRMWLAVLKRAAADRAGEDGGDFRVMDAPEAPEAPLHPNWPLASDAAMHDAEEWFRGSPDYLLVMEFVGLRNEAGRVAGMPPAALYTNIVEWERREERERKERTRK